MESYFSLVLFGYDEGETHAQECRDCEKTFIFTTSISYYYDAAQAAYKDIGAVMKAQDDLVEIVARLRQVVNVKG